MQSHARVVVIGGGNMGAGVLYHLAHMGWTDCVLIEKAELTSGATWHAAGLVSRMVGGQALGAIHDYGVDLYKQIEAETDVGVSWHNCGSLRVATSPEHMDWINHIRDAVLARGQEAHIIDAAEVARLNPLYDVKAAGVLGAIYTPDDGHVDPSGTCQAMANGARQLGAKVIRNCRVTETRQLPSGEWEVVTDQGTITAEHVVNAGGYHARQVGALAGLDLPITTMQHHYVVTDAVPEFADMGHEIPVTRDDYFCGYIRREQGSALIGLYDKQDPQAVWLDGCPWDSENELFEPNWDGITPWLENCFERMPALMNRGIKRVVNGGITYTPDGAMMLGPAPGLRNYWLACGATVGIAWGPGSGRALAQWMIDGSADISTRAFDPRRFGVWADEDYAKARATEDYTLRQAMPYPQHQRDTCRGIKKSGAHDHTTTLGATFEEAGGWERPRLYAPEPLGWRRTSAFDQVAAECKAVRQHVGLADLSAFAKFRITGSGAKDWLNAICANRIPRVGRTCLTLLLNRKGTIEGEATIARTGPNSFYFVTGAPSERRVWDWLTLHCNVPMADVTLINETNDIGILGLAGPQARKVLEACTTDDVSNDELRWMACRHLTIAGVPILALRLSFSGELAYELHAPNNQLGTLWDILWNAGQSQGIAPFGTKALDSLRLEKFYRGGHELANDASHKDVAQERFALLDKDFIGKDAMLAREPHSKIALLALEGEDTDALMGEAVFKDGTRVGSVTSAAYGYSVGHSLAIAFLADEARSAGTKLQISILGKQITATVLPDAPWDPGNERLRT
ncbi:4-methylaminobutanoate oxidase (formaldehyde-forming) [Roseovarius albus]|uniref:4-methylaminobutanoate oxidase (Formaldehyde-forming) n=1 Tax=Roseovarius albus TaxID=1247867 RepID=A0A1X7A7D8_9RHOB|nr:FAD-dependent oxidoreductase [Roseovarius albus]SLN72093.1 4-methylaminobutanoate oxidase (formaldehyde-forming) [Roseovarius albus]